jgi:hypothetical protein
VDALLKQIKTIPGLSIYVNINKSGGGKIFVVVKKTLERLFRITFRGEVGRMLGFTYTKECSSVPNKQLLWVADKGVPDITGGSHFFYIYCSLVEGIMVNEKTLPLLGTLNAEVGEYGVQVVHNAVYPMFVKCIGGLQ